jgi:putative oxidoreductase
MSVATVRTASAVPTEVPAAGSRSLTSALVPAGRALFAAIFLGAGPSHFAPAAIAYARSAGVPFAELLVPASGVLAFSGGLSVLLGWRARLGAAALIAFLVPVTLSLHAFWAVPDPMMAQMQYAMFMKNAGLLGGALLILHFGAGPLSLDARAAGNRR